MMWLLIPAASSLSPPEAVDFTLVWSKYKNGIGSAAVGGEDDQLLSLMHHHRLKEIMGAKDSSDAELFAESVWNHVSSEIQGYTTKRTGGAGGTLDFQRLRTVVANDVHRAEPFFVQTSATSAHAVYISAVEKIRKARATIVDRVHKRWIHLSIDGGPQGDKWTVPQVSGCIHLRSC